MKKIANIVPKIGYTDYVPGLGWEVDLDESTCTPHALARISMPDEEREIPDEQWEAMYLTRVSEGYYENVKLIDEVDLPF